MRAKLMHSQQILEAIALEDLPAVATSAEQLKLLSLDSSWQVLQTEDYMRYSEDFRRAADLLANSAANKNLDAAVLAYFRLKTAVRDASIQDHGQIATAGDKRARMGLGHFYPMVEPVLCHSLDRVLAAVVNLEGPDVRISVTLRRGRGTGRIRPWRSASQGL
jgi:hypothetical protein